jgi:hypothetical protein
VAGINLVKGFSFYDGYPHSIDIAFATKNASELSITAGSKHQFEYANNSGFIKHVFYNLNNS